MRTDVDHLDFRRKSIILYAMDDIVPTAGNFGSQNCNSCKIRHEKCDRTLPGCSRCAKRCAPCTYSTITAKDLVNRRNEWVTPVRVVYAGIFSYFTTDLHNARPFFNIERKKVAWPIRLAILPLRDLLYRFWMESSSLM